MGVFLAAWIVTPGAQAQDVWNGLGADAKWGTDLNWADGGNPGVNFNEALTFGGTTQLNNTNDLIGGIVNGLTFDVTAGAFILNGNSFTNTGGIANNSTSLQTINNGLSNNVVSTITLTAGGGDIALNGNITGSGGIATTGAGTLTLNGNNGYTGATTIGANTIIKAGSSSALGGATGSLTISSGGTLDLNGTNLIKGTFLGSAATCIVTSTAPATLTVGASPNITGLNLWGAASLIVNGGGGFTTPSTAVVQGTGFIGFQNQASLSRINTIAANLGVNGDLMFNGGGQLQTTTAQTFGVGSDFIINGTGNKWNFQANSTINGALLGAGTFTIYEGFGNRTLTLAGSLAGFTGSLILDATLDSGPLLINLGNASNPGTPGDVTLVSSATKSAQLRYSGGGNTIVPLGSLTGSSNSVVQNNTAGTTATWQVGSKNTSTTYAGTIQNGTGTAALTKVGTGTLTLSGFNTYTGPTIISNGVLALTAVAGPNSLVSNTVSITVASGAKLDVSGMGTTFNLNTNALYGSGVVTGAVTTASGAKIYAGSDGGAGFLSFSNSLTMVTGAKFNLDVSTVAASGNDQVIVAGPLTLNSTVFNINALGGATPLDTNDYVLVSAASISGSPNSFPNWVGIPPANSNSISVVVSNNKVLLHYTPAAGIPPSVTASITPSANVLRGQSITVNAVLTPGSLTVTNVSVDLSEIGGSAMQLMTDSGDHTNYSWTATVQDVTAAGSHPLIVKVIDTAPNSAFAFPSIGIISSTETWDGGAINNNWSSASNWVSDLAPGLAGDTLMFSGTVRTNPVVDKSYSINSLTFDSSAGMFTIGSSGTNVLALAGLSGTVENDSTNLQSINAPIVLNAPQTVNSLGGDIQFNGIVSGSGGITKTGNSTLILTNANSYAGATTISAGTLQFNGGSSMSPGSTLTLNSTGTTDDGSKALVLRSDTDTTFTPASIGSMGPNNTIGQTVFYNINANNLTPAVTGKTLVLNAPINGGTLNGNVQYNLIGSSNGYTLALGTITKTSGANGANTVFLNATNVNLTVAGFNDAGASGGLTFMGNGNITIGNTVQGNTRTDNYNFNSSGAVTLTGNASATGGGGSIVNNWFVNSGTVNINNPKALKGDNTSGRPYTATLTMAGGNLDNTSGTNIVLANAVAQAWNADFSFLGSTNLDLSSGTVTLGGSRQVGVNANTLTVSGVVLDSLSGYGLTKIGGGTLALLGANVYSGATVVSNGTLIISSRHVGNGSFSMGDGTALVITNDQNGAGATLSDLTFGVSGLTTNVFENITDPTIPLLNVAGAVAVNGSCIIQIVGTNSLVAGNVYPLIHYGSFSGNFTLQTPANLVGVLTNDVSNSWIALQVLSVGSAVNTNPTNITMTVSGNNLTLAWPADHTGWRLQTQTNSLAVGLSTNWTDVAGASTTNQVTFPVNAANGSVFFRLVYP